MEPVRVVCPSCHGKLVVRLESMLGQIVVCPRCKSNVQIPASPPSMPHTGPSAYDSSAITRVDDGLLAQRLADETGKNGGLFDLEDQAFESAIDAFRPVHDEMVGTKSGSSLATKGASDELVPLEPIAQDDAISSPRIVDWNLPETRRRRQILMIAMAGIVTTLIAMGSLIAFLRFQSERNSVAQAPVAIPEPAQPSGTPSDVVTAKEPSVATPDEPSPSPKEELPEKMTADPQANSVEKMLPDIVPEIAPEVVPKTSIDASETDGSSTQNLEIPASMMRFSQVFDPGSLRLLPDAIANEKPTVGAEMGAEKIDIETLYHPSPVSAPSWEAIQSKTVSDLNTKRPIPLNGLLLLLGQLSGAGFVWDVDAIRMSGYDVDRPITISVEATTIGELLKLLCSEQGFELSHEGQGQPRLRPVPDQLLRRLPTDWSLDDIATQESSLATWQALLKQLYPAWNDDWQLQGTTLRWSETASPLQRATMAAFLDQVRIAYGLPPKSTLPDAVTDPRLGLEAALAGLNQAGTRIIEHPMSMPQLLDIAARDSGLKLVFDWESLFSHGFSHAKATTSLLRGRNWSEIAKWGLDEFSLVAVIDGVDQIVLTTLPRQRRIWRTIIVKLDSGKTIESIRESLRTLSPTDDSGHSTLWVSPLPPLGDTANSWVVVRVCPPNTFQLQTRSVRDALRLPAFTKK